jgi:hypothetical protein
MPNRTVIGCEHQARPLANRGGMVSRPKAEHKVVLHALTIKLISEGQHRRQANSAPD